MVVKVSSRGLRKGCGAGIEGGVGIGGVVIFGAFD